MAYVYKPAGADPGNYTDRHLIAAGLVQILPDIAAAESTTDHRSHAKKVLDALESVMEGKATKDVGSYSIGGKSISKMSPSELIEWRSFYLGEYRKELDDKAVADGFPNPRKVGIRFNRL